jgi:hypothetical protein
MPRPKTRSQTGKSSSVKKSNKSKAKSSTNVKASSSTKKKLKKTPKKRKQSATQSEDERSKKRRHYKTAEETGSEVDSDVDNDEDSHNSESSNDEASNDEASNYESSNDSEYVSVSCSSVSIAVSSGDSSCIERNSSVYAPHIVKVSSLFEKYDAKLMSLNFRRVERQIEFSKLYSKIKSFMLLKKQTVKPKQPNKRTSWEFMHQRWLAYATKYPHKKNSVSMDHDAKLNNWVKEQRRAFTKNTIKHDRFVKLHSEGFNFQPRKLEQRKKRKVKPSGRDMTLTPAAVGKSSSTHVQDAAPNSASVEKKKPRIKGKAVQPSATAPPLEVSCTVPPTDAVVDVVPTSVDLGHVGISDEVLPAAADLGAGKETTATVPPTEALPISSTLPSQGEIGVNLPPVLPTGGNIGLSSVPTEGNIVVYSLPTGDNIGLCSQVHNQSEVAPKVHYDSSDIGSDGATVALVPTGEEEEEVTDSIPATVPIPVDMGDIETTDQLLIGAAELGTQDETATMLKGDGTKVHYDASDIVKDGDTVALGLIGKEEEVIDSLPATGPIPVDMGDTETTDQLLSGAAELGGQVETVTTFTDSLPATGPIPVDMGETETTDQLLFGAAELGRQDETATTLPGDGTSEHNDASEVMEGHATIAVVPSAKRELRQRVGGRNDGDLGDVTTKRKSHKKKKDVDAPVAVPKDDVLKRKVLKKKAASKEDIVEIDESKLDNSGPNNLMLDALVQYPNWINLGDRLDHILVSKFIDKQYDRYVAFFVDEETKQYPIYYGDFRNYMDKSFMSHAVIDGYFWLLDQKFKDSQIRFANCALWSRYISCFDVSSEQLKKVVGKFLSPEDNFLYIPIHIGGNHWCLAQINIPGRSITFVDPLDQFRKKSCKRYTDRLSIAFGFDSSWNIIDHYNDRSIQRQNDSHSCAFFTCWYSHQLAMNYSIGVWMDDWESRLRTICRDIMSSLAERVIIFSH